MGKLFVGCLAMVVLSACAAENRDPATPANLPPGAWQQPPPAMQPAPAPLPPPPAMQTAPAAIPSMPAVPWASILTFPPFTPAPQAPPPGAPPPPASPAPPPAQPAPPPFALPQGFPQLPMPSAWPSTPPPMPSGLPAIPGLPGFPQDKPPVQPGAKPVASSDVAQRCVDDINGYRATKGLAPLARWGGGEACATQEAANDSQSQRPHGSFGACQERSQNACPNWSGSAERMTDDCLRMMWSEGPGEFPAHGHYNNMVDTRVTKVACGTYAMPDGRLWAVQDFQ